MAPRSCFSGLSLGVFSVFLIVLVIIFSTFRSSTPVQNCPLVGFTPIQNGSRPRHRQCSATQAAAGAIDYEKRKGFYHCPTSPWIEAMHRADPSPHKTIVVIGCNKGYDALRLHRLWDSPEPGVKPFTKVDWMKEMGRFGCGACEQCKEDGPVSNTSGQGTPHVYCLEASPTLFKAVQRTSELLGYNQRHFYVGHKAFIGSSVPEVVLFPENKDEVGRVGTGVEVSAITLDNWVIQNSLEMIDILAMDTEGYDARVLLAGSRVLSRVRYLEFECHTVGEWAHFHLQDLIEFLDNLGMVCFWAGRTALWRITGCWSESYELYKTKDWSNIVCAPLVDPSGKVGFLKTLESFDQVLGSQV